METNKIKVLVLDNDPRFLEIMKINLENKDCFVQCVSDPLQAMSLLINETFHIALIDCVLDSGQTTDLIQDINAILGNSVEIIMMSGIVPEGSLSDYVDQGGIRAFLPKPISNRELEENLKRIKEKYIYGNTQNILFKLFGETLSEIQILKFLTSLKKAKDYEFFLCLNEALLSKSNLVIQFQINNTNHKILCNEGVIIDYESNNSNDFLNKLLAKKIIEDSDTNSIRNQTQKEQCQILLKKFLISHGQVLETKYDLLIETLKQIVPGMDINITVQLGQNHQAKSLPLLSQSEFADLTFLLLNQKFKNHLYSIFDKEVMKTYLIFEKTSAKYLPESEALLSSLKSGMNITGAYDKHKNDKSFFCLFIYILLKGNVKLSVKGANMKYYFLYERYKSFNKFIQRIDEPTNLFIKMSGFPDEYRITPDEVKKAYFHFLKHNHVDTLPQDIPKDLQKSINLLIQKIQRFYEDICNSDSKLRQDKKEKKERVKQEILLAEKRKICERFLEDHQYQKAFSLIKTIPEKTMNEEIHWQMLFLWLHFKNKDRTIDIDQNTVTKYMKNIQSNVRDLNKNKFYQYILGLYYENKQKWEQAKLCFEKTKLLDPSFQPCYSAIKKSSLWILKNKKKEQSFMDKLQSFSLDQIKKHIKKRKKAG